jgi:hypothetical protein
MSIYQGIKHIMKTTLMNSKFKAAVLTGVMAAGLLAATTANVVGFYLLILPYLKKVVIGLRLMLPRHTVRLYLISRRVVIRHK